MNRKQTFFVIIGLLLLLVLTVLYTTFLRKTANITLVVAPSKAQIILDGQKSIKTGKLYVAPGQHTIKATLPGFTDVQKSITASKGKMTMVTLLLNPNSAEGYKYLQTYPDDELAREALGGQQFDTNSQTSSNSNPLIKSLPFIDQYYRIDYGPSKTKPNNASAVAFYVTLYNPAGKQQAMDWLTFKGLDLATAEIYYQTN